MIQAKSLAIGVRDLVMCDRLIANCETSRNILYKDHERRKRRAEKAKKVIEHGTNPPPSSPDIGTKAPK